MTLDSNNVQMNPSHLTAAKVTASSSNGGGSGSSSGSFVTGGESTAASVPLISADSLTPSQRDIAQRAIHTDGNVFLTGAAGVGKSYLLRFIIEQLKVKHPAAGAVAVTAPTGTTFPVNKHSPFYLIHTLSHLFTNIRSHTLMK